MDQLLSDVARFGADIHERTRGFLSFRFALQPLMAVVLAVHDGMRDARAASAPFVQRLAGPPDARRAALRDGLHSTLRLVCLGVLMDLLYQYKVIGSFRPTETMAVVLWLCLLPYALSRGPVERVVRAGMRRRGDGA